MDAESQSPESNDCEHPTGDLLADIARLQRTVAALPDRDRRSPEELNDERGLPT